MKRIGWYLCLMCICVGAMLCAYSRMEAAASEKEVLVFVGEDSSGLYRYEFADGTGFISSLKDGESDQPVAFFEFDSGILYTIEKDGEPFEYSSGQLITVAGQYVLRVVYLFKEARLSFSIKAFELSDVSGGDIGKIVQGNIVERAKLAVVFLPSTNEFSYAFPNGAAFTASAPSGAVINDSFSLTYPEGMAAYLWKDDVPISYDSGAVLVEEGVYRFTLQAGSGSSTNANDINVYMSDYIVRVHRSPASDIGVVYAPPGFYISRVSCDGVEVAVEPSEWFRLTVDGLYVVESESPDAPGLSFVQRVLRDVSVPEIIFSEDITDTLKKAVSFQANEPDAEIKVVYGGLLSEWGDVLDMSGFYKLTVSDAAGNSRTYNVHLVLPRRIMRPLHAAILVGGIVVALAVMVIVGRVRRPKVL